MCLYVVCNRLQLPTIFSLHHSVARSAPAVMGGVRVIALEQLQPAQLHTAWQKLPLPCLIPTVNIPTLVPPDRPNSAIAGYLLLCIHRPAIHDSS